MSRPGDWICRSCQHLNFQRRDYCRQCGEPKTDKGDGSSTFVLTGSDVRPGDWYCAIINCGAHNFATRTNCFKCGKFKDNSSSSIVAAGGGNFDTDTQARGNFAFGGGGNRSGWKSGDWLCSRPGCKEHNFASRMKCFRCHTPRQ